MQLTPTARVILGVLGLGPRTGYDVKKLADRSTRFFWSASYGQIYPELRRLQAVGLVEAEEPSGGRRRRVYRLTDEGRAALHGWLTSDRPLAFEYRDEALLKLFFGDLMAPQEVLGHVRRVRGEAEEILEYFGTLGEDRDEDEAVYPYRALDYGVAFMEWVVDWWAALERELEDGATRPPRRPPPR
jgi:DNA-binding PadR family transcriptional regulator